MTTNLTTLNGRVIKQVGFINHNHINDRIVEKQQQTLIRMKTREMYPF